MKSTPKRSLAAHIVGVSVILVYLWPVMLAVWTSFSADSMLAIPTDYSWRWYQAFWASARWRQALVNSVLIAGLSTAMATVAAFGLAVITTRRHYRFGQWLAGLAVVPMLMPPVVLGMALLPVVRWSGAWGHLWSVAAAHAVWTLPVAYLVQRDALAGIDRHLEWAARGLGASATAAFSRITLPLVAPSVVVAAIVAFVMSINEFIIALFLTTPATETLPKVIWPSLRYTLTPIVSAASGISMLFAVLAAGAYLVLVRRADS